MYRVLIVDDHAIVRRGMMQVLEEAGDEYFFGEAENGAEAIQKIQCSSWDVVLLDIAMPGRRGIDVLAQIKQKKPKQPVLILSSYPEEQYAVRLIRAGAAGYLNKQSAPEKLVDAVRAAVSGKKFISSVVAGLLADNLSNHKGIDEEQPQHEKLSDREYHVFIQLALGVPLTEIAQELCLSVKTVATYRTRLLEKMNMRNNAELTLYAIRNQLIE